MKPRKPYQGAWFRFLESFEVARQAFIVCIDNRKLPDSETLHEVWRLKKERPVHHASLKSPQPRALLPAPTAAPRE